MKTQLCSRHFRAFSLVEVLTGVAVLGILAAIVFQSATGLADRVRQAKLESDVQALNSAVRLYLGNGGSLAGVTGAADVIAKLKTVRDRESAARYVGFRGSMLDARISPVMQTPGEAASSRSRAFWNAEASTFEIGYSGQGGISRFDLDSAVGAQDFGEEVRDRGAVDYNAENGWIWAYQDSPASPRPAPATVAVGAPAPVALPEPQPQSRLATPQFDMAPGSYEYPDFPATVAIRNPNPQGSSTLYVATAWDGSGVQWFPYTGPVPVVPGMQILACARQASPGYADSFTAGGVYVRNVFSLQAPEIVTSSPHLDLQSNSSVTIELIDPNPDFALRRVEYSINGGSFAVYEGPLSISPGAYVAGIALVAKTTPAGEGFRASPEVAEALSVKLLMPVIEVGQEVRSGTVSTIPVTLSNPNPEGSSSILYALRSEGTGSTSGFQEYTAPFVVDQAAYPEGFTVVAYANPVSGSYLASDEASSSGLTFFGIPVTGDTIFVLDRSGSMAWEDGIGQVKAEMNRVLDMLETGDKFGIIQFSTEASVVMNWSLASDRNVTIAKNKVNRLTANGWTNYSHALSLALEAARQYEVKQVVFLSDGAPTSGNTNPDHILSLVRQIVEQGTRVDTLAFGLITPDGRDLLERMDRAGDLRR